MRTKALLCAAAMAAGAMTAAAQSNVYSLNVVGYVNLSITAGGNFTLINNPLDNTTNDLNTLFPGMPNGTSIQTWNSALQDFDTTVPSYKTSLGAWVPDITIAPGQAFFIAPAGAKAITNTFVGQVRQGSLTNYISGGGNADCVAMMVPIAGDLNSAWANGTNVLTGYLPKNGDTIQTWNADPNVQDFDTAVPSYKSSLGTWVPNRNFNVGDGFFLSRAGTATNWVLSFTVK